MQNKKKASRSETPAPSAPPEMEDKKAAIEESVEPKKSEVKKEAVPVKVESKKAEIPCTFSRWFRMKGFKPHWQAGMEAYTDVSVKRTPEDWERIFKAY